MLCFNRNLIRLGVALNSINAVGVDIARFSAMRNEEEVLLLPGLPLVNRPGRNPEPDLWAFEVETPDASVASSKIFTSRGSGDSPSVMIDYVHPGISEIACLIHLIHMVFVSLVSLLFNLL